MFFRVQKIVLILCCLSYGCAPALVDRMGTGAASLLVLPSRPTANTMIKVNGEYIFKNRSVGSVKLTGLTEGDKIALLYVSLDNTRTAPTVLDTTLFVTGNQVIELQISPNSKKTILTAFGLGAATLTLLLLL